MGSQQFKTANSATGGDAPRDSQTLETLERAASMVCKRWKPALLYLLSSGNHRYNNLARRLSATTPKMLTQQLRELERDGLVFRIVHSGGRRHVEYALTPMGEALRPVMETLALWGRHYLTAPTPTATPLSPTLERESPRDAVQSANLRHAPAIRRLGSTHSHMSTNSDATAGGPIQHTGSAMARRLPDDPPDA